VFRSTWSPKFFQAVTIVDPLHVCISMGPLSVYLLLLGGLNLSSRPFLTTGGRDTAALGLAVSGFLIAGPMELFLPETAALRFGGFVWLMMIAFYALSITLVILLQRPRLVIYNATRDQMRPILADLVGQLDQEARWAGECLVLPRLGIQLHLEAFPAMRNVQLVSSGSRQSFAGWRRLETALVDALRRVEGVPSPYGLSLIVFGLMAVGIVTFSVVSDSQAVAQSLREMLRQ
jgi:uncharacterized protein YejL (UPF0352 family)